MRLIGAGPSGSYATTLIFQDIRGRKVVSKTPHSCDVCNGDLTADQVREIAVLKYLPRHKNIVKIRSFSTNSIETYHAGQTLNKYEYKGHYKSFVYQLVDAISFLHYNNIAHRDLSLKNIVIKGKKLTIIDFGMSRYTASFPENGYTSRVTSLWQRAPELLTAESDTSSYQATKVDDWSVGILIADILGGIEWIKFHESHLQKEAVLSLDVDRIISYLKMHTERWFSEADYLLHGFLKANPQTRLSCLNARMYLGIKPCKVKKLTKLYPLGQKSSAYLTLRSKYLFELVTISRQHCKHRRTFTTACSILDAYQENKYDNEWDIIASASLLLASKLFEREPDTFELYQLLCDKVREASIIKKQRKIIQSLNTLIFLIIDDIIKIPKSNATAWHEIKEDVIINNCTISVEQMMQNIYQRHRFNVL